MSKTGGFLSTSGRRVKLAAGSLAGYPGQGRRFGLGFLGWASPLYPDLYMPDLSAGAAPEPSFDGVGRGIWAENREGLGLTERALMTTAAFDVQPVMVAHGFVEGVQARHA